MRNVWPVAATLPLMPLAGTELGRSKTPLLPAAATAAARGAPGRAVPVRGLPVLVEGTEEGWPLAGTAARVLGARPAWLPGLLSVMYSLCWGEV